MGRAAAAYGKFSVAKECWEAAGHWSELLPLCALQGDFASLRSYAATLSAKVSPTLLDAVRATTMFLTVGSSRIFPCTLGLRNLRQPLSGGNLQVSALQGWLVPMGHAAAAYGKGNTVKECRDAAGHWSCLFLALALQGDLSSMRRYAAIGLPN